MATAGNALKVKAYQKSTGQTPEERRDEVVLKHLQQIKYIAQRIAAKLPPDVQLDDLISAGVIGLLDAYEKFDENKGVKFKTYAEVRIRGAILDSLRDLDWAPRSLRKRSKEVEEAYARLEQRLGRSAEDEEIAEELGLSLKEFHALVDQLKGLNIGHFQIAEEAGDKGDSDDVPLRYVPAADEDDSPFEMCLKSEIREMLTKFIKILPEREQLVIALYYDEELTMKEIGKILGVNESRISQLHTRAMLRLRARMQKAFKR
ncbi:MAG TPA: FliA/WhiG family RNA polymerase sigma factor [Acidobacteriota bacterium]|nr:FliA/WhiG family RNA polymerase sigma factor [Acidobacteriota bacterium]